MYIGFKLQDEYDYLTNLSAAYLMSDHSTEGVALLEKYRNSQSYEVLYNYGTLLIFNGQYEEAETILRHALQVGRRQLYDAEVEELELDIQDEGSEPELDPIRVQLAFIAIRRGNTAAAEKSLMGVVSHGSTSKIIHAIATCNLIAARGCTELAEGMKRYALPLLFDRVNNQ